MPGGIDEEHAVLPSASSHGATLRLDAPSGARALDGPGDAAEGPEVSARRAHIHEAASSELLSEQLPAFAPLVRDCELEPQWVARKIRSKVRLTAPRSVLKNRYLAA